MVFQSQQCLKWWSVVVSNDAFRLFEVDIKKTLQCSVMLTMRRFKWGNILNLINIGRIVIALMIVSYLFYVIPQFFNWWLFQLKFVIDRYCCNFFSKFNSKLFFCLKAVLIASEQRLTFLRFVRMILQRFRCVFGLSWLRAENWGNLHATLRWKLFEN